VEKPLTNSLKVEFQFDFGSPNAYLAELVIPSIERRTCAKFEYVPVLLGGIYKATGNMSPAESPRGIKNKPEYQALETERFIRRHNITKFTLNPFFPINTLMLMRGPSQPSSKACSSRISALLTITCGKSRRRWTIRRDFERLSGPLASTD
jgi:2-hydroxychromene-2-carboxylate isomerase